MTIRELHDLVEIQRQEYQSALSCLGSRIRTKLIEFILSTGSVIVSGLSVFIEDGLYFRIEGSSGKREMTNDLLVKYYNEIPEFQTLIDSLED